ncbi:MAG: hypothetical protein R3F61_29080 [Myxococcota bacterium]
MRIGPDELDPLIANAARLGIETPLVNGYLRQNWGRCVFWDAGCRLHAELGVDAKPTTCRQFPVLATEGGLVLDPACFHADPDPTAPAPDVPLRGPAPVGPVQTLPWDDLELGHTTAARLRALPLRAVLEGPRLGSLTRTLLEGLEEAAPAVPDAGDRDLLQVRANTVLRYGLAPREGLADLLVGGGQLVVGAGHPVGAGFAAWVRLLRTGVV